LRITPKIGTDFWKGYAQLKTARATFARPIGRATLWYPPLLAVFHITITRYSVTDLSILVMYRHRRTTQNAR
jgi:hypothetical protein